MRGRNMTRNTALVEVEFHPSFPKSLKKETLAALKDILPLAAIEISTLRVTMTNDDNLATISVVRPYRRATLALSQEFFDYDAKEKRETLKHEMGHVILDPLTREMARVVNFYVEDPKTKAAIMEHFEEEEDRVVEGLAIAWEKRYG